MATKSYNIAVIGGDGTGPEVVAEGLKVLKAASKKFGFSYKEEMFDYYDRRLETITAGKESFCIRDWRKLAVKPTKSRGV